MSTYRNIQALLLRVAKYSANHQALHSNYRILKLSLQIIRPGRHFTITPVVSTSLQQSISGRHTPLPSLLAPRNYSSSSSSGRPTGSAQPAATVAGGNMSAPAPVSSTPADAGNTKSTAPQPHGASPGQPTDPSQERQPNSTPVDVEDAEDVVGPRVAGGLEDSGADAKPSGGEGAPLPLLPAPGSSSEGTEGTTIEVNGEAVALDHLGPMVVGVDGTLSRIANWAELTDLERRNTLRVLGKRNQLRLGALRVQSAEGAKGQ